MCQHTLAPSSGSSPGLSGGITVTGPAGAQLTGNPNMKVAAPDGNLAISLTAPPRGWYHFKATGIAGPITVWQILLPAATPAVQRTSSHHKQAPGAPQPGARTSQRRSFPLPLIVVLAVIGLGVVTLALWGGWRFIRQRQAERLAGSLYIQDGALPPYPLDGKRAVVVATSGAVNDGTRPDIELPNDSEAAIIAFIPAVDALGHPGARAQLRAGAARCQGEALSAAGRVLDDGDIITIGSALMQYRNLGAA
jgi:hypothetical protein